MDMMYQQFMNPPPGAPNFVADPNDVSEEEIQMAQMMPIRVHGTRVTLMAVLVKGLPAGYPSRALVDDLTLMGYDVFFAHPLPARRGISKGYFKVEVMMEDVPALLEEKVIGNNDVAVKPFLYTPLAMKLCYNCMRYGHLEVTCTYHSRCYKCGRQHKSAQCRHPKWYTPCLNCNSLRHKAISKHCPARKAAAVAWLHGNR